MDLSNTYRFREYYENDLPLTDLAPKLVNSISTSAKNVEADDDENEKTHTHLTLKQILTKEITNQKHLTTLFMKTGDVSSLINLNENLAMNVDLTKLPGVLNEQKPTLLYPFTGEVKIEAKDKVLLRDPKIRLKELQDDKHTQEKSSKAEDNKGVNVDNLDFSVFQKSKIDASKATFLMRTEYSTRSKSNAFGSNSSAATDLKNKLFLKQQKTQKKLQRLNGSEFVERIQKSFQSLDTLEDKLLKSFKHPVKKNLKPKRVWKLLPDANTMDENFISLKLNGSAAITTNEEIEKVKLNTAIFRSVQLEEDEWMSLYSLKDKKLNNDLLNEQEILKGDLKNITADYTPNVYLFNRIRDYNIKEDTTNENNDPEVFIQFDKDENVATYKIIRKQLVLNKRRHNDLLKDIIKENNFDKLEVTYNVPTEEEQMESDNVIQKLMTIDSLSVDSIIPKKSPNQTKISANMSFNIIKEISVCKGKLYKLTHESTTVKGTMNLNLYVPPKASKDKIPTIYYLSGLTCTPDNCTEKGFVQFQADKFGFAVVYPDTSPRNVVWPKEANVDTSNWALGEGAGFYLNSDRFENFKMFDYICKELPESLSKSDFGNTIDFTEKKSVMGHSMGGMGALTLYLKGIINEISPYVSCSAFAPVANPTDCPWGVDAFKFYFQDGVKAGESLDPTLIIGSDAFKGKELDILVTAGNKDPFFKNQLRTENFIRAIEENGIKGVSVNIEDGFDHSYFFVSTFVPQHCEFHAKKLGLI